MVGTGDLLRCANWIAQGWWDVVLFAEPRDLAGMELPSSGACGWLSIICNKKRHPLVLAAPLHCKFFEIGERIGCILAVFPPEHFGYFFLCCFPEPKWIIEYCSRTSNWAKLPTVPGNNYIQAPKRSCWSMVLVKGGTDEYSVGNPRGAYKLQNVHAVH